MKKSFLLWMSAMLMLSVGMVSCSSDDDDENINETTDVNRSGDVEVLDENHKFIVGEWQLRNYYSGWGISNAEADPSKLTLTFNKDGKVTINVNDEILSSLFPTGTFKYSFEEKTLIKGKEPIPALVIGESPYEYLYSFIYSEYEGDELLRLWEYCAYDGLECNFKKVK